MSLPAKSRPNALKSTGPKTPRGKGYSRGNALKHGLFAMDVFYGNPTITENLQEYRALLNELRRYYEPLGIPEELEVERIATSWWKLKRAWRYENAELICAQSDVELALEAAQDKEMTPGNRACIALLRSAQAEIRDTGGISDELREKMFGTYHGLRELFEERVGIAKGLIVKY